MVSPALCGPSNPRRREAASLEGWPSRALETTDMPQIPAQLRTLDELIRQHAEGNDLPRHLPHVRLADALARGTDPLRLIEYFRDLDRKIENLEDLLAACADPGEEEIEAYRVEEGIAVFFVTDGQWAIFTR